jgi:hypothetical protein
MIPSYVIFGDGWVHAIEVSYYRSSSLQSQRQSIQVLNLVNVECEHLH